MPYDYINIGNVSVVSEFMFIIPGDNSKCSTLNITLQGFPTAETFVEKHLKPQQAVKMKGAAKHFPAYRQWTDEYMHKHFGDKRVGVEPKKEHRKMTKTNVPLKEYLGFYKTRNVYSVTDLGRDMG